MSAVAQAAQDLKTALATVEGFRVYSDLAAVLDPPAVMVGAPELHFDEAFCLAPSRATFPVFVVAAFSDRSMEVLWDAVPAAAAAVDALDTAAVVSAQPTVYPGQGRDLPAYVVTVEVTL